jgi:hypothetical protein
MHSKRANYGVPTPSYMAVMLYMTDNDEGFHKENFVINCVSHFNNIVFVSELFI